MSPGDNKAASKEELGQGRQQVSDSRSRLLKLKAERDLEVSAVRVAGDEREAQRRTKEEEERQVPGCSHTPKSQYDSSLSLVSTCAAAAVCPATISILA